METNEFMGILITSLATLLGIVSIIVAIIIRPIINLNKSITKLNVTIDSITKKSDELDKHIHKHDVEIVDIQKHLICHDSDIKYLKERGK